MQRNFNITTLSAHGVESPFAAGIKAATPAQALKAALNHEGRAVWLDSLNLRHSDYFADGQRWRVTDPSQESHQL